MLNERLNIMNSILDDILDETCRYYNVDRWDVLGDDRTQIYVNARITFAIVSSKYIDNKSIIARYVNKHPSTFHNWVEHEGNPTIGRAVSDISESIQGVVQVYKNMKRYFNLKEELGELKRKRSQIDQDIQEKERLIEAAEQDIKLEDLKI